MKKINNLLLALASIFMLTWTACTESVDYEPAKQGDGPGIYFPNTIGSTVALSKSATTFDIEVCRESSTGSFTANVTSTDGSGKFTIPTSVAFSDGSKSAILKIGYNPDALDYDAYFSITLTVTDESGRTVYGNSTCTFNAGIPSPYVSLGKAQFNDAFVFDNMYEVELQQNTLNPNAYRLVNPYAEALAKEEVPSQMAPSAYLNFEILPAGSTLVGVKTTVPDLVYFSPCATGYYMASQSSSIGIYHPSAFTSLRNESNWVYSRVLKYTEESEPAVIQLAPMYYLLGPGGAYNYSTTNGMVTIIFPGVVIKDYALDVVYAGKYMNTKNEVAGVIAKVNEIGEDLEYIRLVVVEGTDVNAAVEGVSSGKLASIETTRTENTLVPFAAPPVDGTYTLVAVGFEKDEVQTVVSAQFKYTAPTAADTWEFSDIGDYEYSLIFIPGKGKTAIAANLELYRSKSNPNRWKIEHWGEDVDFVFTYDPWTGEILVDDQETGYVDKTYGTVFVDDLVDYTGGTKYGKSYFADGVFHFALIYYDNEDAWAYGYETFTLKGNAKSEAAVAKSSMAPWSTAKSKNVFLNARQKMLRGSLLEPFYK